MKKVILTIADISLSLRYKDKNFLSPRFRIFKDNTRDLNNKIWHLESLAIKRSCSCLCSVNSEKKIGRIKERFRSFGLVRHDWLDKRKNLCYLQSQYPKILPRVSFYFNDPIEIDIGKKKIRHFYSGELAAKIDDLDPQLITFAYSQILAINKGMLLHCACVVKNKEAYLFFGPSEGGKSTAAKLSKKYSVLGDDIIAVREINKRFLAFSTPWIQKNFMGRKNLVAAPLKAAFFLKKAQRLYFKPLRPEEALVKTLSGQIHFFLYTERPLAEKIFFTAANFFKTVPAYEMHFRKDRNFWPLLEKTIE